MLGHGLAGLEAQTDNSHRAAVGDLLKPERAGRLTDRGPSHVNIIHATGIEGARRARGTVVVIDVLRSFTVSAYALAGGARECRLVKTVAEARALAEPWVRSRVATSSPRAWSSPLQRRKLAC